MNDLIASSRARVLGTVLCLLSIFGCSTHTLNIQTAATGTLVEAQQVVALVYGQGEDTDIDRVLYSGGDLTLAINKLRARYPKLVPLLDQGAIGNTASGFVALRDTARHDELRELLWEENRDRAFLYNRASVAVGHGGDTLGSWLPYASFSFGQEWISQGHSGWWWMDPEYRWHQGAGATKN